MGFNSAFKGLKLLKKNPGNGRLNNLNDPVLNVLSYLCKAANFPRTDGSLFTEIGMLIWGTLFLDPEDIRELGIGAIWNFAKETGFL